MSNVSANVIQSMFNHLTASYTEDEARDILVHKYPDAESEIREFKIDGLRTTTVEMGKVTAVTEADGSAELTKAVKAKVAKPKAEKPVKEKKASKVDLARELYEQSEDKSRAAMIAIFMDKLGMSKAAASTYFYNIKG